MARQGEMISKGVAFRQTYQIVRSSERRAGVKTCPFFISQTGKTHIVIIFMA